MEKNKLKKKLYICISLVIFAIIAGVASKIVYESYFHEYYGRNEEVYCTASILEEISSSILNEEKDANADMILSNHKKFRYNDNLGDKFYERFEKIAKDTKGLDYDKGQYYIEIRDHKVYKVIYATWMYSGYAGVYPQYSDKAKAYKNVVKEARKEFEEYIENK